MKNQVVNNIVSGAIYDFAAWLTTREEQIKASSKDDAAPIANAVKEFLKIREVDESNPLIQDWQDYLVRNMFDNPRDL